MDVGTEPGRGLTSSEVAERVADGRVNDVPEGPGRSVGQIVRANVLTRFNALLGVMLAIILVVGPIQDGLFGLVLVANTTIGIVQELRAKRTLERLQVLTAPTVRVIRDGDVREVGPAEVVLDDVIEASAGDQVVVDGEVIVADGAEIDESLLTGESDPVRPLPGGRLLSGSFVVAGLVRYRATAVGSQAYSVRLASEARRFTLTRSELRSGIDRILRYVTWAIVPTAALLFWSQLQAHENWREAVSGAVAGTVAMVPEGLVLLTSIAFAAATVRLTRDRVLVQELQAVEGRSGRRAVRRQDGHANRRRARGRIDRGDRRPLRRSGPRARRDRACGPCPQRDLARDRRGSPRSERLGPHGPGCVLFVEGVGAPSCSTATVPGTWGPPTGCSRPGLCDPS